MTLFIYLFTLISIGKFNKIDEHKHFQKIIVTFIVFLCWTMVVNGFLSMSESELLLNGSIYFTYNVLAVSTIFLYYLLNSKNIINDVLMGVKLSVTIQFIISFFVLTSGTRQVMFFNNPNQLGYYGLIMITFLLLFSKSNKDYIYVLFSLYFVILSNSSAAIIGSIVIIVVSFVFLNIGKVKKILFILIFSLVSIYVYLHISLLYKFDIVSNVLLRFEGKNESAGLVSDRGYGRIFELGFNFLWGVGEGAYDRFIYLSGLELHSTFLSIFVSYGLIGLILFLILLNKFLVFSSVKSNGRNFMFIGLLLYWFTHQGIRNTLFWILLATYTIYVLNNNSLGKKEKVQ